ncbi:MAG: diphthine--ammonia ligase [Candidatus Bathyarchaeota archaeon]|nr:diphthine--ammonia ligase [Candidatus Bathyarchaeota archaeon]
MKVGVLFSGGKDSTLALHKVVEKDEVCCLITILSLNPESYMFHTPNINITAMQAEALGIPIVTKKTEGKKEEEVTDLEEAISQAKKDFDIEGIVTGAVESIYQAERIQRLCNRLDLCCLNPLWKHNQKGLLEELISQNFKVIISGIFAYPLDEKWLGKELKLEVIEKLVMLQQKFGLSPSGEGGEIETTVLDAPLFKKKIEILDFITEAKGNSGIFKIKKARFIPK